MRFAVITAVVVGGVAIVAILVSTVWWESRAATAYSDWLDHRGTAHEAALAALFDSGDRVALAVEAEAGDPYAQAMFGLLLCTEGYVDEAESWFERAAGSLHPPATLFLVMLAAPSGATPADLVAVAKWSERLRLVRISPLRSELQRVAEAFAAGPCVAPEDRAVALWFAAAVLAAPPNYVDLADRYARNDGIEPQPIEELALNIAAFQTMDVSSTRWAEDLLAARIERLEEEMAPAEIDAARARAREWLAL